MKQRPGKRATEKVRGSGTLKMNGKEKEKEIVWDGS